MTNHNHGVFQDQAALNKEKLLFALAIALSCGFAVVQFFLVPRIFYGPATDFESHISFAKSMMTSHSLVSVPHPLWHILVIAFHKITPGVSIEYLARRVMPLICQCACISGIFLFFASSKPRPQSLSWLGLCLIASQIMLLVGPINFLVDDHRFLGYIPANVYWSPTQLLAKPLTVCLFFLIVRFLLTEKASKKWVFATVLVTLLALLAKPSYVIAMLPVIGIFCIRDLLTGQKLRAMQNIIGVLLPAGLLLICQLYVFSVGSTQSAQLDGSHIIFSPFGAMGAIADHLGEKCLLSMCYPIMVVVLFYKQALQSLPMKFAWGTMLVSLFYTYFLAESGGRLAHVNFLWSSELALFVVFIASTQLLLQVWITRKTITAVSHLVLRQLCCILALFLHIAGGILLNYYAGRTC